MDNQSTQTDNNDYENAHHTGMGAVEGIKPAANLTIPFKIINVNHPRFLLNDHILVHAPMEQFSFLTSHNFNNWHSTNSILYFFMHPYDLDIYFELLFPESRSRIDVFNRLSGYIWNVHTYQNQRLGIPKAVIDSLPLEGTEITLKGSKFFIRMEFNML